ncbi:hypothetical protein RZM75_001100 [Pseudomonas aeruginosa]|nr:hypothetical protein [Pseudomonas aeruginosa]
MTESKICTCPSGDGSLRWPCPAHPAVEQSGGDERAAFEAAFAAMGRPVCRADYDQDAYGTPFDDGGWTGWQARAALAQPSPVRSSLLINGYQLRAALDFIAPDGTAEQLESEACIEWRQQDADFLEAGLYAFCAEYPEEGGVLLDEEPTSSQPSPAQAEAERPEVVARVVHSNPIVLGQCGPLNANDELMTVAQHAASVARWAEMFNSVEQQRDAALAEVAGLMSLLNSLLCYVERDINRMRSDRDKSDNKEIYDRSISLAMERLKAAQNAVFTTEPGCDTAVELAAQTTQAQHSVPEGFREKFEQCMKLAFAEIAQYVSPENARDPQSRARRASALATELRAMLAAAPSEKRSCEYAGCCNTAHPGTSLCIAHHSKKAQERLLAAAPQQGGRS